MEQATSPVSGDDQEREKEELEELHSTFIRNVGHELRTPLTIMQGYAELLRDGELGQLAPEQQEALFVIVNRTYELRTLVERVGVLLEVQARSDTSLPLTWSDVVLEVVQERREAATQAGLTVNMDLQPDVPSISGNPYQLRQAFDCLLDNAIKFTPSGGRIDVKAYTQPGWICLAVADTGIGIPEDKLQQLFTGFYQVDGSTTRRHGGIGLGLTVANAVAKAHSGHIEVESQPGRGSSFVIKLPVAVATEAERPMDKIAACRRVLVVDDEENVALTLQDGLEKLPNCDISIATSGDQALLLFEKQPFDLLITDYKMPGTDGMTLATRVRQLYPQTTIVMITAYSSEELRAQAASASIQHILDKPVKLAEIRSVALEALEQSSN